MSYREHAVPATLRGLVECGWVAGLAAGEAAHVQDVLPDGCMDLVLTGGDLLVAGPDTGPHPARREPGVTSVGLRFAPGRLPALLGVPAVELRDRRVALADLQPGATARAVQQLERGARPGAVLVGLASALPGSLSGAGVPAVVGQLARGASAAATADALGWTTRSLHRHCLAAFGYGPAVLRRILRFRRAAALLHQGVAPAQAASMAGYADQPHLSREVRALAGVAPGQLGSGANRSTPVPSGSWTTA